MRKGILIVGSLNMDMVIEMERMPKEGETLMGKRLSYIPGGKGANQACAAGRLGGRATMLGCVGNDSFGTRQRENLMGCGVCMDYLAVQEKQPTGTAVIYVDEKGANSIVVVAGANSCCSVEYLKKHDSLFWECDYVMFQMEIPEEAVFYGISRAKELGKITILNPAPAPETLPDELWKNIDYLTPNETELIRLAGMKEVNQENIRKGARKLLSKGVKNILVTLGSKGVLLVNERTEQTFPARRVQAVDTTAAGDCFNGAFAAYLAEGNSKEAAIEFANLASSLAVTRKGAQSSIPKREEVEKLMVELKDSYSVCKAN